MKKTFLTIFVSIFTIGMLNFCTANATTHKIIAKSPTITPGLKPIIEKYRQENYLGAMLDLEELLKTEKTNTYAKYYLALCYTRLGYQQEAKQLYSDVASKEDNFALTYYAKRAITCLDNPDDSICFSDKPITTEGKKAKTNTNEKKEVKDDITKFIESGKMIHPSVQDEITKNRLKRKMLEEERERQQAQFDEQLSKVPTNEEIAQALNTLTKIGMNPFQMQNQTYSMANLNNQFLPLYANNINPNLLNNQNDISQMLLYSQLMQPQNNFGNYGI